ncbi:MAG: type II toxin-antitoxin system PemK/MazF family toxin [Candidatus Yanofskybacteria bacterium]|nr:type II toxin-antitoxin system PemK/MazF family toxin [Candidatus Yanofskybacteria bacterium]
MKKDFQKWHKKKEQVDDIGRRPFFHEREIWFCYLGVNVGFEQDGVGDDFQRPVVVIRKFNNEVCWVIPLSKTKKRNKYYFAFQFDAVATSVAIISQVRLLDARRLSRKIGEISVEDFNNLINKIKALLP